MPRKWIVVTILVVTVLLIADVVAASIENRRASTSFATTQHLTVRPYVHINGWPFVLQGLRGHYGYITLQADPARTTGDASIGLRPLRLSIRGVVTRDGFGNATADRASGTARIGYGSLSKGVGQRVQFAGGGRVFATVKIRFEGKTFRPSVSAVPAVRDGDLVFRDVDTTDQRGLPTSALGPLQRLFAQRVELGRFPFGIEPTSVYATSHGVTFKVSGRDLQLGR